MTLGILWPTFALVALIFAVWATLLVRRLGHIRSNPPGRGTEPRLAPARASYRWTLSVPTSASTRPSGERASG